MGTVAGLNFKLRTDAGYSIFPPRSESSRHREFSYGRYHRIST
jgi:hypothetical protein